MEQMAKNHVLLGLLVFWALAVSRMVVKQLRNRNNGVVHPKENLIQATYKIRSRSPIDPAKKAQSIALGQTTDTWTPNERSGMKKLEKHRGIVLKVEEIAPQQNAELGARSAEEGVLLKNNQLPRSAFRVPHSHVYLLTIGFPPANTENDIPTLLTMIFGKISLDGQIRVENISFPESYLKGKGPRFGIEGIRKKLSESSKPLTMAIFKPCVGLTPKELAGMFYELALGGMHLVKDDEILPDLNICPTEKRLDACLEAAAKARKETGKRTLYAVNLTGPVSQLLNKARRLAKQGAECFLFNVLSYGYGALEELRQVGVPIMAHPALAGGWSGSPDTGLSYRVVLGSLMRLGGADIVLFPSSYGTVALPKSETDAIKEELTKPLGSPSPGLRPPSPSNRERAHQAGALSPLHTKGRGVRGEGGLLRSFPGPSAGIHPGLVPQILKDYGRDVIINAGGGVHGHPQGARAGARAFQQAVDRALKNEDFKSLTESDAPELSKALALWGHG